MRLTAVFGIFIFIAVLVLIDIYAFQGIRTIARGSSPQLGKILKIAYWAICAGIYIWIFLIGLNFTRNTGPTRPFMQFAGIFLLFLIPKLVVVFVLMGEDIFRLLRMAFAGIYNMTGDEASRMTYSSGRRKFVSQLAFGVAAIPFAGIIHGLTVGKFKFTVRRETLYFPDLPDAFDGFTITQISDVHSGSFDPVNDREELQGAINLINAQKSDLLLFTGDLVNNKSDEMEPWIDMFSKLHAPYGKYSVLGNHDYGHYVQWPSPMAKVENLQRLFDIHKKIGFNLLRNENVHLEKEGSKISLLGVENWGVGFGEYGDIDKTLAGVDPKAFKVLMSHDPSHWEKIVRNHPTHVHLTLSGHTHGMQFGIEIPGIKWSPVKFRYPYWAGLYETGKKYIYVNRGFGFLAFPARVGIWPEITVLTLKKKATA